MIYDGFAVIYHCGAKRRSLHPTAASKPYPSRCGAAGAWRKEPNILPKDIRGSRALRCVTSAPGATLSLDPSALRQRLENRITKPFFSVRLIDLYNFGYNTADYL